ncbi:WD40 repeat domain-containing protein [Kitasatospora sp. NPDC058478]|uniref:WD40 repeat domain-containing protein n=1 Tax=unclassified Kitasatospora TaxID=2633591 RepID=UPI00365D69D1
MTANEERTGRPDPARRVFARLMRQVKVGGTHRWDLASPYLLRHAAEHAAESGGLHRLFQEPEFLVHADPRSILTAGALPEAGAERLMPIYQTSLARHINAEPEVRRHVLAVDAVRYRRPDLSDRLYHPPYALPAPWQCRWSTAGNVSLALRATLTASEQPVRSVATGLWDGWPFAITAGDDRIAHVWDIASGTLHHELHGHTAPVTAIAVGRPEQRIVVTADAQGTLRRWDPRSGEMLTEIGAVHAGSVTELLTHVVDGVPVAVTCGADGTIYSWDLRAGRQRHLLAKEESGPGPIVLATRIGYEPLVVIGYGDDEAGGVVAVSLVDGTERHRFAVDSAPVIGLAVTGEDEDSSLVITTEDENCYVWDLTRRRPELRLRGAHQESTALRALTAGEHPVAVIAGSDGSIEVWAVDTGQLLHTLNGHTGAVTALAWYIDDSGETTARSAPTQTVSNLTVTLHGRRAAGLAAQSDRRTRTLDALSGHVLVSASEDRTLRTWNLADGRPLQILTAHTDGITAVAVADRGDGRPVAVSGGDDATARVWDLDEPRELGRDNRHPRRVEAVAAARAGERVLVATGCGDHWLRIFDASKGKAEGVYAVGLSTVTALGLGTTTEGPVVVTVTDDGGISAREPGTGKLLWRRSASRSAVADLAVGGSARRPAFVILRADGQVYVHDLTTGRPRGGRLGWRSGATSIATGRIGEKPLAVVGYRDGLIEVWNLASGRLRRAFSTNIPGLRAVAFGATPSEAMIASRHADGSIRTWDADTGRRRSLINAGGETAMTMGTAQGRLVIVTADRAGDVRFREASTGEHHALVSFPEAAHTVAAVGDVLAVGFGSELAILSTSDNPGPWLVGPGKPSPTPVEPQQSSRGQRIGRLSFLELAVLGRLHGGHARGLLELKSAFGATVKRGQLKAALRTLQSKNLIRPMLGSDGYEVSAAGVERLARRARRPVAQHRTW